ncbi:GATA zinc finger domain-containing protein 14-like [Mercenaria mercenaria]|uniref:GATA zinc finger domain-containing protein 14-like n=1 Tax=Mercenaria mercenaria TaxID=6596 RepID=UPI00234EA19B|nr:GATA zinc finger domain-containing protein 14-like [Mercenaria mercenaria]
MNLNGITFFHEKQQTDTNGEGKIHKSERNSKPLHAFSHFMPDQSKLSLAAGLSRVASESKINFGASGSNKNNLLNYAPKDDVKAPFTSEVVGFESKNSQLPENGSNWKTKSFTGNDVIASDNSQLINFSQLGIMKENVNDVMNSVNDVKEISYFNTGSNGFAANSNFDISAKNGNDISADNTGGGDNMFNKAGVVENNFVPQFNNNGYIFDNAFASTNTAKVDISAQAENSMVSRVLPNENIEPLVNDFPNKISITSSDSFASGISNSENAFNNIESTISVNAAASTEERKNIVKPFPFEQLHGKPTKLSKRVPTLKTQNDFVDNSRKPILTVKSAFVDLSGRQNPNMKTFGNFIDKSNEMTPKTTIQSTTKPTTPLASTTKTTLISSVKTSPTIASPESTRPSPVLTGLGLPGVLSVNPNQISKDNVRSNSKNENKINTGSNKITSQDTIDTQTGNSETVLATTEPPQDKLNVDMLYPPAPFPAIDQSNTISSVDQTGMNKLNINTADVASNVDKEQTNLNNGKTVNTIPLDTVPEDNNRVPVGDLDYDYDMYADIPVNVNNGPSSKDQSNKNIPLVQKNNGDIDRFITDPNVQIINPSNQMIPNNVQINPNGQNEIRSRTGIKDSGLISNSKSNVQNFVNDGRTGFINRNTFQTNGQAVQNNIKSRQMNTQDILSNDQRVVNNQINSNEIGDGQVMQGSPNAPGTRGTNGQFGSDNVGNNQNILNRNAINPNLLNRLKQNFNSFSNGGITSNQNGFTNQNVNPNGQNIPIRNTALLNERNEILQQNQQNNGDQTGASFRGQTNFNNIPSGIQSPDLVNNPSTAGNAQNNLFNINTNQRVPTKILSGPQNIGQNNPNMVRQNQNNPNMVRQNQNNPNMVRQNQNNLNMVRQNQNNPNMVRQNQNNPNMIGQNQNNPNLLVRNPSQFQNIQGLNRPVNTVQTGTAGISVPNINSANRIDNNLANMNRINAPNQRNFNTLNLNRGVQSGTIGQNNINTPNNNIQNGQLVSNNINGQIPRGNNFQSNLDSFPRNINGLANNIRTGQNVQIPFQNQNNILNTQTLGTERNIPNFSNGIQGMGQNNRNMLQNRQFFNPGNFQNNVPNIPTFQGNVPQFQNNLPNNILRGNIRNGLNNFGPNNAINFPGMNRFPSNVPLNSNPFGPNALNRQFGSFR